VLRCVDLDDFSMTEFHLGVAHSPQGAHGRAMVHRNTKCSGYHFGRQASFTFNARLGFSTQTLVGMLDYLVRVSRRDVKGHFGSALTHLTADPPARVQATLEIGQSKLIDYPTL